jgi:hypothetical protein
MSAKSRRFLETNFKLLNTILLLGCRNPLPSPRRLLYTEEPAVEPRWEGSRSPDVGVPVNSAGGYQALGTMEPGSLRRSRRLVTTFGD